MPRTYHMKAAIVEAIADKKEYKLINSNRSRVTKENIKA